MSPILQQILSRIQGESTRQVWQHRHTTESEMQKRPRKRDQSSGSIFRNTKRTIEEIIPPTAPLAQPRQVPRAPSRASAGNERRPGRSRRRRPARLRRSSERLRGNSQGPGDFGESELSPRAQVRQVSAQLTCFSRATAFPPLGLAPPEVPARSRDESGAGQPDRCGRPVPSQQQ